MSQRPGGRLALVHFFLTPKTWLQSLDNEGRKVERSIKSS